jgi:DNA polymerase III sliding clamp (beta) subunit (PCNA family)
MFAIRAKAGALAAVISKVSAICGKFRSQYLRLYASNGDGSHLLVTGADRNIVAQIRCDDVEVGIPGCVYVVGKALRDCVDAFQKDETVKIDLADSRLSLFAPSGTFAVPTYDEDETHIPVFPEPLADPARISLKQLTAITAETGFAIARDAHLGQLYGYDVVKLELGKTWAAIATDGTRMAVSEKSAQDEIPVSLQISVPPRAISTLRSFGGDTDVELHVYPHAEGEDGKVLFVVGAAQLLVFCEERGGFPEWRNRIPDTFARVIRTSRSLFEKAVERATVLCHAQDTLRIWVHEAEIRFSCVGKMEPWESKGVYSITRANAPVYEVAVDPKLFQDGVHGSKADEIEICLPAARDVVLLRDNSGYRYVVATVPLEKVLMPKDPTVWPTALPVEEEIEL